MNQIIAVVIVASILQAVIAAPVTNIPCNKLEAMDANNRYLVLLQDDYTDKDAEQIQEVINEYQSSLERNGSKHDVIDSQSVIRSQLTYLPNGKQLSGTLSEEAILLVSLYCIMHVFQYHLLAS